MIYTTAKVFKVISHLNTEERYTLISNSITQLELFHKNCGHMQPTKKRKLEQKNTKELKNYLTSLHIIGLII